MQDVEKYSCFGYANDGLRGVVQVDFARPVSHEIE
jgi:hypothetical protein